jgi:UDPglucose--hexose-1-phosphate uridylyltransferase
MRDGRYELDLVLRNNITTDEHPMGLYHPWEEFHHIKKENIGLIEVMGLAVLPARLKDEMEELKAAILNGEDITAIENIAKHAEWVDSFLGKYDTVNSDTIDEILQNEIGIIFKKILECAGVYKRTETGMKAFKKFADYVNQQ